MRRAVAGLSAAHPQQPRSRAAAIPLWRAWSRGWVVEVVALFEVVDEPGMGLVPPHQLAGQRARGRAVDREEAGQPAKVLARVRGRDGDYREVEMAPDHLGDGADRHALIGDPVPPP